MAWYPCCCSDNDRSIYVPCCLYGIQLVITARLDKSYVKFKSVKLTRGGDGLQSVDHGREPAIDVPSQDFEFGGLKWYFWGLDPISPKEIFLPHSPNWQADVTLKNVYPVSSIVTITEITLQFQFFLDNAEFEDVITLHPTSVTGTGWTGLGTLVGGPGTATAGVSICSDRSLSIQFGEIDYTDLPYVIDTNKKEFRSYEIEKPTAPGTYERLCFQRIGPTTDAEVYNRNGNDQESCADTLCLCNCTEARADPEITATCNTCSCFSLTPWKIGGYGNSFPDPPRFDITTTITPSAMAGSQWTIFGRAKWRRDYATEEFGSTLFWYGEECTPAAEAEFVRIDSLALTRRRTGPDSYWELVVREGDPSRTQRIAFTSGDLTFDDQWFFFAIRKKPSGSTFNYDCYVGSGDASGFSTVVSSPTLLPGDYVILGEDSIPTYWPLNQSFAGCVDSINITSLAWSNTEILLAADDTCP